MRGPCPSLAGAMLVCASAPAGDVYYVSAPAESAVQRLEDLNGDGDALDAGERTPWADGLAAPAGLAADGPGLFVAESDTGRILRLEDLNGDGDALDAGEAAVWAEGLSVPMGLARRLDGVLFVSDFGDGNLWRVADLNGDGDALDADERALFAAGLGSAAGVVLDGDGLLVASNDGDQTRRLLDGNGDGDALDAGENLIHAAGLGFPTFLLAGEAGCYFAAATPSSIVRVCDLNGDGDGQDAGEVLPYAGGVFAALSGPIGMAPGCAGDFLVAEQNDNQVSRVRDLNGDGDAYDIGDVTPFAAGIPGAFDIAASDRDGDQVIDCLDNCPDEFNPDQQDTNRNGQGDACDTCPWDCANGDGQVGIEEFLAVLGQWGTPGSCDLDGGGVGITEFLKILGTWGPCP